jgi:hypothetical protein
MSAPTNPFAALAASVLPEQTSARLARLTGANQRVAQRWITGELEPLPEAVAALEHQRDLLAVESPAGVLDEALERWRAAGLDDEVVGAALSMAYEKLLDRKIR